MKYSYFPGCSLKGLGRAYEESLLRSVDFSALLMQGMLSLMLFAGALGVDLHQVKLSYKHVCLKIRLSG